MKPMNARFSISPQTAVWGICFVAIAWLAATIIFEMHLGLPHTGIDWAKRAVGWGVEILLVRALVLGARKCGGACAIK